MRTSLVIFAVAGVVVVSVVRAQNLVVNGDAETGSLASWSSEPTGRVVAAERANQSTGWVYPFQGRWFFSMIGSPGSSARMWQTGTSGTNSARLILSGRVQTENLAGDDFGEANLQAYDSDGILLASASTGSLITPTFVWAPFSVAVNVPTEAASWRVELKGTLAYGSWVNVFYDAVALEACDYPQVITPPEEQTTVVGDTVNFSVAAQGTGDLTYQWRKDGDDLSDDTRIDGSKTAMLTIGPAQAAHAGSYDVVVTDVCGSVVSNPATLTVLPDESLQKVVLAWDADVPFTFSYKYNLFEQRVTKQYSRTGSTPAGTAHTDSDYRRAVADECQRLFRDAGCDNVVFLSGQDTTQNATIVYFADHFLPCTLWWDLVLGWGELDPRNKSPKNSAIVFWLKDPLLCLVCGGGGQEYCDDSRTPQEVARVVAHETGHTLGLQHTTRPEEIMLPTVGSLQFVNNVESIAGQQSATHNTVYHLRRWVDQESRDSLEAGDVQPGTYDEDIIPRTASWLLNVDSASTSICYDAALLQESLQAGSPAYEVVAEFHELRLNELAQYRFLVAGTGRLRLLATTAAGSDYDMALTLGDATAPGGLDILPEVGVHAGQMQAYAGDGLPPVNVGDVMITTTIPADLDTDGDVDLGDFNLFRFCWTGPAVHYAPDDLPSACSPTLNPRDIVAADFDMDRDVDQSDFAAFQRCYTGQDNPVQPNCGN